jgi:hypothetical protein
MEETGSSYEMYRRREMQRPVGLDWRIILNWTLNVQCQKAGAKLKRLETGMQHWVK